MDYRLPRRAKIEPLDLNADPSNVEIEVEQMPTIDLSETAAQEGLVALLQHMPLVVIFRKTNGDVRHMLCTRHKDWIKDWHPADKHGDEDPFPEDRKAKYAHVCQVFDLEKQEWRSFRYASVIGFRTLY